MQESTYATKDPICGMTVDEATALKGERDGKTFYFCSDQCREKFMTTPAAAKMEDKSRSEDKPGCDCGGTKAGA